MPRLLIVDDEPMVLDVLRRLLVEPERDVEVASGPEEALEIAGRLPIDVALVDKNLLGASGLDLSRKLKTLQPELEVILITGYASLETAVEAVQIGAFDYLTKPIDDYASLSLKVQSAIEKSRLRRNERALVDRLKEAEVRYRSLVEAAPDAVVVHDSQGHIREVNTAASSLYGIPAADVQRVNMLLGHIGETVKFVAEGRLGEAKMRLFHPLGFMLASPIETAEEGLSYFAEAAVEDKSDGIRAQAHVSGDQVRIFSRTRDDITESFPELIPALAGLPQEVILDGEIVAWEFPERPEAAKAIVDQTGSDQANLEAGETKATEMGHARPFTVLQQRLGRKKVSETMLRDAPVAYLVFDVLYARGELLIDRTLRERALVLDQLLQAPRKAGIANVAGKNAVQHAFTFDEGKLDPHVQARIMRAPVFRASAADHLEQLFTASQARGNEGLMIKHLASTYNPGKRGKSWLKMKRELATLDVVVTAVEYGHGKRIGVLSDYTFAVWNGDKLVNIGKAYSGLTDVEIAEMTKWFLEHTVEDQGLRLVVEPKIVLEVAFNNMMESERHESGYALRFPRIVRLRPDKSAEEADTIETVRKIYSGQAPKSPSFQKPHPTKTT